MPMTEQATGAQHPQPRARNGGPSSATVEHLTGAQSLIRSLEEVGADTVFGLPGGCILPAYDPLMDSTRVRHILVRHEQGAGHAATGYAQATGKVGVCMVTSGPGATNLVTPIADAAMDSVPLVAITGQVASAAIGTDAFQEADICGITMPITKHNFLVTRAEDIAHTVAEAFHIASTGRPGPVLVDIAKVALQAQTTFSWPPTQDLPGYRPVTKPHAKQIREAAKLITQAKRPVLYVGGGVMKAGATAELKVLAELTGAPVTTTLMALGSFPDSHPLHVGMPGMHGSVTAVTALQKADLIVALGARFDDRVTGKLDSFAPYAKIVHADIDPAENGSLSPQQVIQRIGELAPEGTIFAAGVGQHQMWASHFIQYEQPATWLNSGGAGTMGYAVPAAMGAKAGMPDRTVWAIDGDGCFQMTNQELTTSALNNIPIKVAIINNGALGMVRQWQTLFYNQRYSNTVLHAGPEGADQPNAGTRVPDFVKLAEAMGCVAMRCEDPADLDKVIAEANAINDRPVVIDFIVHEDAMVWPMVAAGTSNDEVMAARGVRPDFGDNEDD